MLKEQIETLIIFWKKRLKKSSTYEETEETKKNIKLLRVVKDEIDLSELKENYIPRKEV